MNVHEENEFVQIEANSMIAIGRLTNLNSGLMRLFFFKVEYSRVFFWVICPLYFPGLRRL